MQNLGGSWSTWCIREDTPASIPEPYRDWHWQRLRDIRESPKRLCYDEFHRAAGAPAVRETRKLPVRHARASRDHERFARASGIIGGADVIDVDGGTGFLGCLPNFSADGCCRWWDAARKVRWRTRV